MLDGERSSSAFFSNRTLPLEASIRIAVGASPSNPPSSFLAPCTLLFAAYVTLPQPTARATTAAMRPRREVPAAGADLRERLAVIGLPLGPVLTVGITANNKGCARVLRLERRTPPAKAWQDQTAIKGLVSKVRGRPTIRLALAARSGRRRKPAWHQRPYSDRQARTA